ncbi:plakophilin-3 isoform X2 [Oryzias latipes]|uniref:Plakophilin 3 n=1 Tax=Oryzias latipes TaxID=8090 RepID=H2LMZ7_ORYLA|nr:plakophilin-3 isoform X2 [Oryzias latipes]
MTHSSSTTYALPSDVRAGNGGAQSDEEAKARRVQEQIKLRMAEKSTLPRQNGKASYHPMSDYGGTSTMKYSTYSPGGFTSKSSYMYNGSRTMGPRISQRADFSSRSSGPAIAQFQRMSVGGGVAGGGGGFYTEDAYQGSSRQHNRVEPDAMSVHSMRQVAGVNNWRFDDDDARSMMSERDSPMNHQFTQSAVNGYGSQMRQSAVTQMGPMHQSLSGINYPNGGMSGGGAEYNQQQISFRGPSHRTISRITNRNRMSVNSMPGNLMSPSASSFVRDKTDGGFIAQGNSQGNLMRTAPLSRTMSMKSIQSVGRGADIYGGQMELGASMATLNQAVEMDIETAVTYIRSSETGDQKLGAASIQHQCYNNSEAKDEVRKLKAIGDLVKLFNSRDETVRRYATGAARNLIYENQKNKEELIKKFGITELIKALGEDDDELRKNITGILWNLSSKDPLKKEIAKETIPGLTDKILKPLAMSMMEEAAITDKPERQISCDDSDDSGEVYISPPDEEIFCNTTGCFRNLSSASAEIRQLMRSQSGLVESLVTYIKAMLYRKRSNNKGVENSVCTLRNLSYELYSELPKSIQDRLEGETGDSNGDQTIGCFSPQSKKVKNRKNQGHFTPTEATKLPTDTNWLWHPQILGVYHKVLLSTDVNSTTREATAGALQNLTYGDKRWPGVLSSFAEQKKIIPTIIKLLNTERTMELRSLTGFLRNLARHTSSKDDMAKQVIKAVVEKLPEESLPQLQIPMIVNICGILNNLVIGSSLAAKEIAECGGLDKLKTIRDTESLCLDESKAAKSADTVIVNVYYYKKHHKLYRDKGYNKAFFKQKFK